MPSRAQTLVIRESPWPLRLAAMFMALLGTVFVAGAAGVVPSVDYPPRWERWGIGLIGAVGICSVPAVWRRIADRRVTLDPESGQVVVTKKLRGFLEETRLGFADISSVEIAESRDADGCQVYRPVFRLVSSDIVPVLEIWTIDLVKVNAVVEKIRTALRDDQGLKQPRP